MLSLLLSGFPHSDIHGSTLACSSPWLFVARYVLPRLLAPRHPPYALTYLTSLCSFQCSDKKGQKPSELNSETIRLTLEFILLRKEVIQPHLPIRLPCYDFTPIANPTFDGSFPKVRPPASGVTNSRGVTGGVYKARERIHRSIADLRLLATPTSCRRVAACNPN